MFNTPAFQCSLKLLACTSFAFLATNGVPNLIASEHPPEPQPEEIREIPADALKAWVDSAPLPHFQLDQLGLKLRLIDYIDCTNADDPHDFRDQGTSQVVQGTAGLYRVSAPHRHSFFSYGYKTAGRDKPVLLLIEYPDDATRRFTFYTHDAERTALPHRSFTPNAGVFTGDLLPLSNQMQYLTLLHWPRDMWSPLIAMSHERSGAEAAASRVWVYAVDEIPPLEVNDPDPSNPRILDLFIPAAFLAERDLFGWKNPQAIQRLARYCKWIGFNRITLMTYLNQSDWGAMMQVPAWDIPTDNGYLDRILTQLDEEGGVGAVIGIAADGMYGVVKSGGRPLHEMEKDELQQVLFEGLKQIIDHYGHYSSFQGIALGSMETIGFYDTINNAGLVEKTVEYIKSLRPDLEVITYLGSSYLQHHYFMSKQNAAGIAGRDYISPPIEQVIEEWGHSNDGWDAHLSKQIIANWKNWGWEALIHQSIPRLQVYEKILPDDFRIVNSYWQQPRTSVHHDIWNASLLSEKINTPYAALFSFFDEGWTGLTSEFNFWNNMWWTGPEFNGPGDLATAPWTMLQAHHDRQVISAGGWTIKTFGAEMMLRRFAQAFRALPPVKLESIHNAPEFISARWTVYQRKRYINIANKLPFPVKITIDRKPTQIGAYELITTVDDLLSAPDIHADIPAEWEALVHQRINNVRALLQNIRVIESNAASEKYSDTLKQAEHLVETKPWEASRILTAGIEQELGLRLRILSPPKLNVPRIQQKPEFEGDLNKWPVQSYQLSANDGTYITGHTFFPNSWHGPSDLSVDLKLAHDGKHLFFGLQIHDNKPTDRDTVSIWLSSHNYRDWNSVHAPPEIEEKLSLLPGEHSSLNGLMYQVTKHPESITIEGYWPLDELQLKPGGQIGWLINLIDTDDEPTIAYTHSEWAAKQTMLVPHDPIYPTWNDARNCGQLILAE